MKSEGFEEVGVLQVQRGGAEAGDSGGDGVVVVSLEDCPQGEVVAVPGLELHAVEEFRGPWRSYSQAAICWVSARGADSRKAPASRSAMP